MNDIELQTLKDKYDQLFYKLCEIESYKNEVEHLDSLDLEFFNHNGHKIIIIIYNSDHLISDFVFINYGKKDSLKKTIEKEIFELRKENIERIIEKMEQEVLFLS